MKPASAVLFAGVLVSLVALSHRATCQTTIPLDPRATYILGHDDPGAINAVPIQLASLGISAGNSISVQTQGDFSFCFPTGCPEIAVFACGVFSANPTLLPADQPRRVPGAIAPSGGTASPCNTPPTLSGQLSTDIKEDFALDGSGVNVPAGANYLFVAVPDSFYGDNADPNGNLAVVLQKSLIPVRLNVLSRVVVDGSDRMTTTGPPELDLFPSEGQMYYVPADLGIRTVSLNRFNNGPDHRDSARLVLPGYENEGPLGFPWVRNVLPGLKPLLEGFNPATGDYALMHPREQLPGYDPASLRVFGYPRFGNETESILSLTGGGVTIESNRVFGGALWRWTWNGKQFLSNLDSLRGSYGVLFLNNYSNYIDENGDDCQNHAPLERAFNDESTQFTAAVSLANSFVYDSQDPCHHPVVWKDALLGKMITLNFHEMGPVARYTTFVSLPNAVPAVDFYHPISSLNAEFNRYFFYDAETGDLQERFIADACEDAQPFFPNFGGVILSDQSGQFAMGAYAVNVSQGGSITALVLLRHVCGDGAYSRIDVIRSGDVPAGYSKYNAYFMTGTVEKVRRYMDTLFKRRVK